MMKTLNKELQQQITPEQALNILKEGNQRFVNNTRADRNLIQQVNDTREGQWPFAVVLSCIDSRTSSELIFDLGIGDVFNARIAGNFVNEDILGSMEFACKVAGAKLIAVVGHTKCGAVKGACDHVQLGNLTSVISKIEPAVEAETTVKENRSSANPEFVEKVSQINVRRTVQEILNRSEILREMVEKGEIGIVGGMHDLESGRVNFYEDTFSIRRGESAKLESA